MKILNSLGYGIEPGLLLDLVYNPGGPVIPPDQTSLERDYKKELHDRFGIEFNHLIVITNMPIGKFLKNLEERGQVEEYRKLLLDSFNPETLPGLMCKYQISIGWDGAISDCDFNLALKIPAGFNAPLHINRFDPSVTRKRKIVTGEHCFGCTAGCGSSCSGALAASA